ncbi:Clu domain-containing protein [Balamuthia mandrillaris]
MNGKASADETVSSSSSSSSSSPSEEENDSQRSAKPGLTSSSAATTRTELPGGLKGGAKKTGTSFRQRFIQQQKLIEARRADFSGVKNELVYTSSSSSASASTCSSLNVSKDDLITSLSWSVDGSEAAAVAYNSVHDWNGKFLELLERSPSLEKLQLLYRHAQDFLHTAEALGRIIINERHLPNEQKIIPPFTSGVAGGEKFLSHGIWFKYAVDVLRSDKKGSSPPTWMYGIDAPDDEKAMKSGGHELKGSIAFMDAAVQDINIPLMVLIDYLGFRLVAIAQLPISAKTIVYGTADGGESIHNSSPQMDRAMRTVAERLNLQPHQVGHHIIAVPADIEGHIGRDGKNYVIDFARVFPPEGIPEQRDGWDIRSIFYKLLRPELVRWNKVPLSSDALSGFQRMDRRAPKYNKDVNEATERLFANIIPSFARKIYTKSYAKHFITFINDSSKHNESLLKILEQAQNRDTVTLRNILTDSVDQNSLKALIVEMHKHGINVRHIGRVRHCFLSFLSSPWHPLLHNPELSSTSMISKTRSYYESKLENGMSSAMNTLLLVEMVVRVVKCIFRKHLRHPSRGSIRFEVLKLLNLLFCGGSPSGKF